MLFNNNLFVLSWLVDWMAKFSRIVKSVIFLGITLYLSRKKEHHPCGCSQTYLSYHVLKCRSLVIARAPHSTNMFNSVKCLACQTLWQLLLLKYQRMSGICVANLQSRYNDLFLSWFSEGWFLFSQNGLYLEEFVVNIVIPALLPFCKKEFDLGFQVSIQNGDIVGAQS